MLFHSQEVEEELEGVPEFVAEGEIEESDLSDLEDWGESSRAELSSEEEEERVVVGKKRSRKPHVEVEYETELVEPRTKLKA